MIVPGLYGYVSATKWLVDIELTTFDAYDPYWVQRGWDQRAPIKTMARIDTPQAFATLAVGKIAIGGVAWAQHRGIAKVEVRVDEGDWHEATLGAADTLDTWRQWVYAWDATAAGHHTLEVRATDATGETPARAARRPVPQRRDRLALRRGHRRVTAAMSIARASAPGGPSTPHGTTVLVVTITRSLG